MQKSLSLFLSFALFTAPLAHAQTAAEPPAQIPAASEDAPVKLDLKNNTVVSLIYSQVYQKAFVGLSDERGIVHFEECDVPPLTPETKVTVDMFQDCLVVEGSTFMGDEDTTAAINAGFPAALASVSNEIQHEDGVARKERLADDRFALYGLPILTAMVGGSAILFGGLSMGKAAVLNGLKAQAKRRFAAGGAGMVLMFGSMAAVLWAMGVTTSTTIIPLENRVANEYAKQIEMGKIPFDAALNSKDVAGLYPLLTRAIVEAISTATTEEL